MMVDDIEEVVAPETTEDTAPEAVEETEDSIEASQEEVKTVDELKEELAKSQKLYESQKIRAEKAEKKAKEVEKETPKTEPLSYKDTIALSNAKVHEDDVDEVLEYARYKKIPISEALKSSVIKNTLAEKAEMRNTAEATTTGRSRSGAASKTGESLLAKAQSKGELPDSQEDLDKLLVARYDGLTKR
jgi:hypothetical protein